MKEDRQFNRRTLCSLRHSYISFRLLEGADIYQIAKNCRTSVEVGSVDGVLIIKCDPQVILCFHQRQHQPISA